MTVFKMCKKYYPLLWDKKRIDTLYKIGKLTKEEYENVIGDNNADY